jgi:hypothetical protein
MEIIGWIGWIMGALLDGWIVGPLVGMEMELIAVFECIPQYGDGVAQKEEEGSEFEIGEKIIGWLVGVCCKWHHYNY